MAQKTGKKVIVEKIVEEIRLAHENFVAYAEDLETVGRKISAENLRDIINAIENLKYVLTHSIK